MCRYAMHIYKSHYVCFACRKMFRQTHPGDRLLYAAYDARRSRHNPESAPVAPQVRVCPQCKQPMHNLGLDFKAPPRDNLKQWEKVRQLYAHGYHWRGCGCNGPGFRVRTLAEVQPFLEAEAKRKADCERARRTSTKREKQKASTRKARREREREAANGVPLSDQYDK